MTLLELRAEADLEEADEEEVDLLDEHVQTSTILVVRLHLGSAGCEIVALVNDEQPIRRLRGPGHRLREGGGDSRGNFAHTPAAADV